uniref:Uncharacterized protein n=1 Tax=Oryzias latipes TaxID=8090 RepID=A0A3P9KR44_ORYLA
MCSNAKSSLQLFLRWIWLFWKGVEYSKCSLLVSAFLLCWSISFVMVFSVILSSCLVPCSIPRQSKFCLFCNPALQPSPSP